MEKIYEGTEKNFLSTLIKRTIKEKNVNTDEIAYIYVDVDLPKEKSNLWQITISIFGCDGLFRKDLARRFYFSKNCIKHGFSITYQQFEKMKG